MTEQQTYPAHAQVRFVMRDLGKIQIVAVRTCDHRHHSHATVQRCAEAMKRKWMREEGLRD